VLAQLSIQRIFGPEHSGGRYKHAPSITQLANGDLYLVFYAGADEYSEDTAIYGTRLPKGRRSWTRPSAIANAPYQPEGNPVVWQAPDGRVWLFYVLRLGATWSTSIIVAKLSSDGARTWSDTTVVSPVPGMMVRNHPLALSGGDILLPAYYEVGDDPDSVLPETCSTFFLFDATKRTWTETNRVRSRLGNLQPAVVPITSQHLVCFCRAGGSYEDVKDRRIVRAESRDGGRTWSAGTDTEFKNPNSAVECIRLKNGHILLIYNDSTAERTPLTAAISTDGARTFPHRRNLLEGNDAFAYPSAVQTEDGKIHLVLSAQGRTVILHVVFEEKDIVGR